MAPRKGFADLFGEELWGAVIEFTRMQTVEIMNDLAEAGPVWSGAFRDSWRAIPQVPGASGRSNPSYPYELRDIPRFPYDEELYIRYKTLLTINNEAAHRLYAMDAKKGLFYPPEDQPEPLEEPVVRGKRITSADGTSMRGDVLSFDDMSPEELAGRDGRAQGSITAEDGWFMRYKKEKKALLEARKPQLMSRARRTAKEKIRRRAK